MIVSLHEVLAWAIQSKITAEREGFKGVAARVDEEITKLRAMADAGTYRVAIVHANDLMERPSNAR